MKDNPYIVVLAADEFGELFWMAERQLEDLGTQDPDEHQEERAHRDLVERVMTRLQVADAMHVCLDEQK